MEIANCNFCGTTSENLILIEGNVKNSEHCLVECPTCHLRFFSPRRAWGNIKEANFGLDNGAKTEADFLFNNLSFTPKYSREEQEQRLTEYYSSFLNDLLEMNPNNKSIFEIGCSIGFFLKIAKEKFNQDVYGCDINSYSIKIANEKFNLLNLVHSNFFDYQPIKTYDAIVALDYIEHSYYPFDDLKKMWQMLNKDGILFLKTFLEELDINKTMQDPPWHAHHFFKSVLFKMIHAAGFQIISVKEVGIQIIIKARKIENE